MITNSRKSASKSVAQLEKAALEYRLTPLGTIYARTDGGDEWVYTQDKSYLNTK